jgi:hypothetical protein
LWSSTVGPRWDAADITADGRQNVVQDGHVCCCTDINGVGTVEDLEGSGSDGTGWGLSTARQESEPVAGGE